MDKRSNPFGKRSNTFGKRSNPFGNDYCSPVAWSPLDAYPKGWSASPTLTEGLVATGLKITYY